jgi:exopolysaccharide biosynthesis polyprenyl glycosylphosphotransferase
MSRSGLSGQAADADPSPQPDSAPVVSVVARPAGRLAALPPDWLPLALLVGDAIIVAASVLIAFWFHRTIDPIHTEGRFLPIGPYLPAIPIVAAIFLAALAINHQYQSWRGRTLAELILGTYSGIGLAAVLVLAAISLGNVGAHYSRLVITYTVVLTIVLMTAERYVLRQYETRLRRQGIGTEQVLMVGTNTASEMLVRRMSMFPQYGYRVCGVLDDTAAIGSEFAGATVVGRIDELPDKARALGANQVFISSEGDDRARLLHLIKLCEDQQLEFKVVPNLLDVMSTRAEVNAIDGLPIVGIRHSRLTGFNAVLKRAIDMAVSAVALIILAIPMAIVAIVIKVTSPAGPVIFRQERIGVSGRPFIVLKFRTMKPDAEAETGPKVAEKDDPRATGAGRVMRKLSIDELPQLINVLRGDMSLVGPRPQPTFFDERYSAEVPRYLERQQVRPGLTGWAEVNDLRGAAPIADRTIYDVYYIEHWSLLLDLKIIMLTALRIFFQRHAY